MTTTSETVAKTKDLLMQTYALQPVILDRGEGVYAWDTDGKKYLDFAAGIAVTSLGHANPKILETIRTQSEKLMMCQASYTTAPKTEAAELIIKHSCFDRVYFCNSGTESVEAALKAARKWAYEHKGKDCNEIIAFRKSFHGRTYGSASVTEKRLSQPFFEPYLPGVHFADFNDIASVQTLVNENTAAIIIEPVQGEGGLEPANPFFLQDLRRLCDKHNICLIFDEVQAGFGRLGHLHAYEALAVEGTSPVEPDIIAWAKGMGGGFPVGAMAAKGQFAESLSAGTHGTTYGGNPLACAVVVTVLQEMLSNGFMEHVQNMSALLINGLHQIQRASNKITDIRGKGLMVGVDTVFDIKKLLPALRENGLMATQAGGSTLRLTPALNIQKEQMVEALEILYKTIQEMDK